GRAGARSHLLQRPGGSGQSRHQGHPGAGQPPLGQRGRRLKKPPETETMNEAAEHGAEAFFREQRGAFEYTLASAGHEATLLQAWDSFDRNLAIQCEGQPPVACGKGCASYCELRETALAPEVFVLANYLRATAPTLAGHGIHLINAVREIDAATRGQ